MIRKIELLLNDELNHVGIQKTLRIGNTKCASMVDAKLLQASEETISSRQNVSE